MKDPLRHKFTKKSYNVRDSDLVIETAHTLRLMYKQPLRQKEGLLTSIVRLLKVKLPIPDHTTLSTRAKHIALSKPPKSSSDSRIVIIGSTGSLKAIICKIYSQPYTKI